MLIIDMEKCFKSLVLKIQMNVMICMFKDEYYDLYDTVLFVNAFENFRDKCIEIYELHPAQFLSAP